MHNLAQICRAEIPAGGDLIAKLLRMHAAGVLRREAPAKMRMPEAPFVESVVVMPPTVQLFCLRPIKFRNASGTLITVQKFPDAEMPVPVANQLRTYW